MCIWLKSLAKKILGETTMIKINFICERCELQSEDIMVSGFVISLDSVPDDFSVFLENGKTIFMCKKCNDGDDKGYVKNG